jgi:hypothetical protein
MQFVGPLPENLFQSVKADFVQIFSDSWKKFICRPELLSPANTVEFHEKSFLIDQNLLKLQPIYPGYHPDKLD